MQEYNSSERALHFLTLENSRPYYMDEEGKVWVDIDCRDTHLSTGTTGFYSVVGNEAGGEPLAPMESDVSLTFEPDRYINVSSYPGAMTFAETLLSYIQKGGYTLELRGESLYMVDVEGYVPTANQLSFDEARKIACSWFDSFLQENNSDIGIDDYDIEDVRDIKRVKERIDCTGLSDADIELKRIVLHSLKCDYEYLQEYDIDEGREGRLKAALKSVQLKNSVERNNPWALLTFEQVKLPEQKILDNSAHADLKTEKSIEI